MTELFTERTNLSEDTTIPHVVYKYAKKCNNGVFVFDRGVQKREVFQKLQKDKTRFVTRIMGYSRFKIVAENEKGTNRNIGTLELDSDLIVQIGIPDKRIFYDDPYRIIIATNPKTGGILHFLTNIFDLSADEILEFYKKNGISKCSLGF